MRPSPLRIIGLTFLLALTACAALSAKDKARDWHTGKLLDLKRDTVDEGGGVTNDYETYTIDAGDLVYTSRRRVRMHASTDLTVNTPIQFAVDKGNLYIKDADGKEHETKIIKKTLKSPQAEKSQ